jgi:hypothetical protein
MLETQKGLYMIAYAIVSIMLGHFVIQRIVRIRV